MKKKLVVVALLVVLFAAVAMAGEKEELQWRLRALIAELNLAQQQLPQFKALQEFGKEIDSKGFVIKEGKIEVKPQPAAAPKKEEKPK